MNGPAVRKVIHVDMDAFYASVEQRDRPELRGRPVIVGGAPNSRGVVATASYEARAFGVRSAMPAAQAARLCPQGVFLRPDFARYQRASRAVFEVLERYADAVEPLGLDEGYLDVTSDRRGLGSATATAAAILREIRAATGLSASAGVAPNKFLAKVASDLRKPGGLVVIAPSDVADVVRELPIGKVPGVGRVTEARLAALGIRTCGDVARHGEERMEEWLGSAGARLARLCRGEDPRPVKAERRRRSCSVEDTFAADLVGVAAARRELERLAPLLERRLAREGVAGRTVTLKVKYADFQLVSRSKTLEEPIREAEALLAAATPLLALTEVARRPVRLLGLGVSHLDEAAPRQLLFPFAR